MTEIKGRGSNPASWTNKPKVGDRHNFRITPEALAVLRSMGKNKASWAIRFLAAVWVELPLHLSKDLIEQISDRAKARVESRDYSVENKETQNEP
jgi:hypothetical protein